MDPMIVAAITALGVIASAYLTSRVSNRQVSTSSSNQLIDQHQEDIKELRAGRAEDRSRITALERHVRIQGDYIGQLRRHIADGNPPPPPPYPAGLIT
ncbi:hypothetical protein OWR29_25610 [Actinoplanes sp. Pm04-4]|uniref:Uncharacterized protein n=1 Tax=Paractinoplanes pyxinae TaxID=2997416 RepID=A0ABT4B727_9ACTN|nr:hypothetical protein [Actinoplanes pyxinae]MCY1141390.1 hypothetical protein [Actinoplanes pyxinae]